MHRRSVIEREIILMVMILLVVVMNLLLVVFLSSFKDGVWSCSNRVSTVNRGARRVKLGTVSIGLLNT